jgi:O-antigen ligase
MTSSRGGIFRWLASSINELAVAWWSATSFYIMFLDSHNEFLLFVPLALGVPLFVWLTWKKPTIARVDPVVNLGVFMLFISILGSYLFNTEFYETVMMAGNIVSALLLFFTLYLIVMKLDLDLQKVLLFTAIYISILMPAVIHNSRDVWGRLEPFDLHPNFVSMMAIVVLLGAMSTRNILVFAVLSPMALYVIVRMQSRASLLAALLAMAIIIANYLWQNRSPRMMKLLGLAFVLAGIASATAALAGYSIFDYIYGVVNNLFLIDDSNRGLDSGASGRSDLWAAAFHLWATHPIFGVGFKGHMQFMPENAPAHNAFLGLLADNGLTGLIGYMLIIAGAGWAIFKRGPQKLTMYGQRMAIIFPYIVYGMLETRAFSFGNTYSLLLLLVAFDTARSRVNQPLLVTRPAFNKASPVAAAPRGVQPVGSLTR